MWGDVTDRLYPRTQRDGRERDKTGQGEHCSTPPEVSARNMMTVRTEDGTGHTNPCK